MTSCDVRAERAYSKGSSCIKNVCAKQQMWLWRNGEAVGIKEPMTKSGRSPSNISSVSKNCMLKVFRKIMTFAD